MTILLVLHLIIVLMLIGVILVQQSESGGLVSSGKNDAFTARGSSNVFTIVTWVLASLFIGNCILMTSLSSHHKKSQTSFLRDESSQGDPSALKAKVKNNAQSKLSAQEKPHANTKKKASPLTDTANEKKNHEHVESKKPKKATN